MISKRHRYDQGQFAILPKEVINNAGLTFEARGLLLYLLEKPVDWRVSNEHLYSQSPAGERHINTILSELKAAGYVYREKVYDPPTRTFRWDTTVYDFPEDNPHFDPARTPTFRMDTDRTPTERTPTKRSDDLILDLPIPNEESLSPAAPAPTPEPADGPEYEPEHPDELMRQMAAALPPQEQTVLVGRMVNALWDVTKIPARTGGTLNRAFHEKHLPLAKALLADGYTADQVSAWYGENGFWRRADFRGIKGEWPSFSAIEETIARAAIWQPPTAGEGNGKGKGAAGASSPAVVVDRGRAEAAWNSVLRAISRFGSNRDREAVAMLDETAAAALRAIGGTPTVRTMNPGVNDKTIRARFMEAYREAAERAARIAAQVGAGEAQPAGQGQGQFAPAAAD